MLKTAKNKLSPKKFAKELSQKLEEDGSFSFYGNLRGLAALATMTGRLSTKGLGIVLEKLRTKYNEIPPVSRS